MKREFSSLKVGQLQLNNVHSLVHSTVVAASKDSTANYGELIDASLLILKSYDLSLGEQLNRQLKSPLTEKILELDLDRNLRWREIKSTITAIHKSRISEKKEDATLIKLFMEPYWNLDKSPLNTKTDQINDLFTKLQNNSQLVGLCQKYNLYELLIAITNVNTSFDELYKQRILEEGTKTAPSASSLKNDTSKSYNQFCDIVEQATNLKPTDAIVELFNTMDELRKKYSPLVSKPASKTEAKAKEANVETIKETKIISAN